MLFLRNIQREGLQLQVIRTKFHLQIFPIPQSFPALINSSATTSADTGVKGSFINPPDFGEHFHAHYTISGTFYTHTSSAPWRKPPWLKQWLHWVLRSSFFHQDWAAGWLVPAGCLQGATPTERLSLNANRSVPQKGSTFLFRAGEGISHPACWSWPTLTYIYMNTHLSWNKGWNNSIPELNDLWD